MVIQQDTREQAGKKEHILSYFAANNIKVVRSKLYVGDWTRLDNQTVCIDTKKDLQEVYGNLVQQHGRFRAECIRAAEAGIKLIVLVEQANIKDISDVANWKNPRIHTWEYYHNAHEHGKLLEHKISPKPPISSERLSLMMAAMERNYGIEWQFCDKSETGRRIVEILGGDT